MEKRELKPQASGLSSGSRHGHPHSISGSPGSIVVERSGFRPASIKSAPTTSDGNFGGDDWLKMSTTGMLASNPSQHSEVCDSSTDKNRSTQTSMLDLGEDALPVSPGSPESTVAPTGSFEDVSHFSSDHGNPKETGGWAKPVSSEKPPAAKVSKTDRETIEQTRTTSSNTTTLIETIQASSFTSTTDEVPSVGSEVFEASSLNECRDENSTCELDVVLASTKTNTAATKFESAVCGAAPDNFEDSGYMSNDENEASMSTVPISRPETPVSKSPAFENPISTGSTPEDTGQFPPKVVVLSKESEAPWSPLLRESPKTIWQEFCDLSIDDEFKRAVETSPVGNVSRRRFSTETAQVAAPKFGGISYLSKRYESLRPMPTMATPVATRVLALLGPALSISDITEICSSAGSCAWPAVSSLSAQTSEIREIYSSYPSCLSGDASEPCFQMSAIVEIYSTSGSGSYQFESSAPNAMSKVEEIYSCAPLDAAAQPPTIKTSDIVEICSTPGNCRFDTTHKPPKEQKAVSEDPLSKLEDAPCSLSVREAGSEGMLAVLKASLLLVGIWFAVVMLFWKLMKRH